MKGLLKAGVQWPHIVEGSDLVRRGTAVDIFVNGMIVSATGIEQVVHTI